MKKLGIGIMMLMAIGCGKEELAQTERNQYSINAKAVNQDLDRRKLWKMTERPAWSDDNGDGVTCVKPAETCLVEVIVTGRAAELWNLFNNEYANDKSGFFKKEDWKLLFPDLAKFPDIVTDIKDNVLTMSVCNYTENATSQKGKAVLVHKATIPLNLLEIKDVIVTLPIL
jgi:hypothetical protein